MQNMDVTNILKNKKIIKTAVIVTIVLIVVTVFLFATHIREYEVEDGEHYVASDITDALKTGRLDTNSIIFYLKNRYGKQPKIPFVEYVDVELKGLNKVKMTVYEKKVVGCISYMNKYLYFDKDGYFVDQSAEKFDDVTYVTGVKFDSIALNEKMSVENEDVFDNIMNITMLLDKYEIKVDDVCFGSDLEVTLNIGDIEVLLGKQKTYDEQIAKLTGLLESAEGMKGTFHMENYSDSKKDIIFNKK